MSSSPVEVTTDPAAPPEQEQRAPEGAAGGGFRIPGRWRGLFFAVAVLLVIGTLLLVGMRRKTRSSGGGSQSLSAAPTHSHPVLRLKGTTEAVQSRAILAPLLSGQQVSTLTIIRLVQSGSRVKQGDLLVEFDRQAQMRDYIDKQADYNKLVDQVLEEQAKENAARAKDETEIKQAEDNLNKAQLEMQKVEVLSRIEAEKTQENLDEATATLKQLRETFDLKRKAAQAGIRTFEIQRDRTLETMKHARANSDLMQIHSPIDGVVVLNTIWKDAKMEEVHEGDQVRPGVAFMQVVDPSRMEVSVPVNQEDFLSLEVGQTAKVYLDAYPQLMFSGKLEEMAPIGKKGDFSSKLRTFAVVFSISGNDAKLMPDLSAAVDVDDAARSSAAGSPE